MTVEELIASLRRRGQTIIVSRDTGFPTTVEEAYRVSAAVAASSGESIGAWKLGGATAGTRSTFNTDKIYYGAVLSSEVIESPLEFSSKLRPLRGEAEIAVRLAQDIDNLDDLATLLCDKSLFDSFAPAIECPWSVVANLPAAGLPALLSDRCAAGFLLLGSPRSINEYALNRPIKIVAGNIVLAEGRADRDLLLTPTRLASEAAHEIVSRGGVLSAGQWISTGGITPCIDLQIDVPFSLVFDGVVEFTLKVS